MWTWWCESIFNAKMLLLASTRCYKFINCPDCRKIYWSNHPLQIDIAVNREIMKDTNCGKDMTTPKPNGDSGVKSKSLAWFMGAMLHRNFKNLFMASMRVTVVFGNFSGWIRKLVFGNFPVGFGNLSGWIRKLFRLDSETCPVVFGNSVLGNFIVGFRNSLRGKLSRWKLYRCIRATCIRKLSRWLRKLFRVDLETFLTGVVLCTTE